MNTSNRPIVLLLVLLLTLGLAFLPPGTGTPIPPRELSGKIMSEEEDLVYEVSWTFFKLGTIRLKTHTNYSAEAYINSYEGIPFVDLHSVHFSQMDSALYSRASRSIEKKGEEWPGLDYAYDLPNRLLRVDETMQKDPNSPPDRRSPKDTLRLYDTMFVDGLAIAYIPRPFIHTHQTISVPTVLYGKLGITTYNFADSRVTTEELEAVGRPVRSVAVTGTTTVEGIYGMTGDFQGWFSDDSAAVPLKGKLKVLIGNVNIELIQWNRLNWTPPTE